MERGNTMERRKTFSLRILLLVLAGISSTLVAQTTDSSSWANVRALTPGRPIEVIDHQGAAFKGELAGVSNDSITVNVKHRTVALSRSEVSLVRVRSGKRRRFALVGAAIGAGAGLGLGVAGGESLSNGGGELLLGRWSATALLRFITPSSDGMEGAWRTTVATEYLEVVTTCP